MARKVGFSDPNYKPMSLCCKLPDALDDIRPISGRVDRVSATEAVDPGSIPGRVKPKTIKIGIHGLPA